MMRRILIASMGLSRPVSAPTLRGEQFVQPIAEHPLSATSSGDSMAYEVTVHRAYLEQVGIRYTQVASDTSFDIYSFPLAAFEKARQTGSEKQRGNR
jgi:hypothetical protein